MNKAINISQAIKDKNPDFRNYGLGIKVFTNSSFPKRFNGVENVSGYYQNQTHLHEQDGFWEVERLPLGENQKYGTIERKGTENKYHYPVIDKTDEEIQSEKLSFSESNRDKKIKEASDAMIVAEMMNETDIETVLGNLDIYPLWEADLPVKNKTDSPNGIPDRFKAFNAENDLTLYEVVLSHTTQADWQPKDTPAMFKVVAPDGVIPVWVKPEGAHDAYQIGDQVHFPTLTDPIYESLIDGNTYSPIEYPAGWELIP